MVPTPNTGGGVGFGDYQPDKPIGHGAFGIVAN